ncbi:uncharacterized protein LOC110847715 [Folsomia candida]|uniref:Uncharacterized protein n=1 Tax=Folsomia candida TaxID=158441 RepID=A0A226EL23_FOLCA|nr:uncharacterized protein LOC110847715 [Folsomia candida]OXA58159.1 hypothetical protein Fcan01_07028 [Folsomia candida]
MSPITKALLDENCDQNVIDKLIKIVQVALQCSRGDEDTSSSSNQTLVLNSQDLKFAGKLFGQLVNANNSLLETEGDSFGPTQNATNIVTFKPRPSEPGRSPHRLQHLEMIKVGVLIFVISIIMLTTCRMVFQLFVRFRPEKPQMH